MMTNFRYLIGLFLLAAIIQACGGKLSEEDRKALHDEMEQREPRQIRDDEIVSHALVLGRSIRSAENDSLASTLGITREVYRERPDSDNLIAGLWDAYASSWENGGDPGENIQRNYPGELIYTFSGNEGDSTNILEVYRIPRKSVILSLQK